MVRAKETIYADFFCIEFIARSKNQSNLFNIWRSIYNDNLLNIWRFIYSGYSLNIWILFIMIIISFWVLKNKFALLKLKKLSQNREYLIF
ncbi:unnamed protein product [Blepharisma stoltei]|uniref:Uncharacterized protein n=1 Tax=Blepharisma stoltei TaxID=1481888 RepID=A0AAU9JUN7_9CILI|nr:unnamed protein product [Blepharisma stoltei]